MVDLQINKSQMKDTTIKPTGVRARALIDERNNLIHKLFEEEFTKSDISVIFNISPQLINSILKNK